MDFRDLTRGAVPVQKLAERLAAMAASRLFVEREFGECLAQVRKKEKRIIAKTSAASGNGQHFSVGFAGERDHSQAVAGGGNHANISCRERAAADAVKLGNESMIIFFIIRVAVRHAAVAERRRVTSGMHAWSAVQRINRQTGVFRQNQFAGRVSAVGFSFDSGIGFKSRAVFDWLGNGTQIRQQFHSDAQFPRRSLELAQLARVAGGDQDLVLPCWHFVDQCNNRPQTAIATPARLLTRDSFQKSLFSESNVTEQSTMESSRKSSAPS